MKNRLQKDKDEKVVTGAEEEKRPRHEIENEIETKAVEELMEMSQGRVGPQEYYKAPTPIYYMPPNTEAMKREAELAADVSVGLAEVERIRENVHVTQLEIERLKTETRAIIAKLLSA